MATLGQIRTRVRNLIIDDNAEVVSEIDAYVRKAQVEAEDRRGLRVLEASHTEAVAEDGDTITKPADWNGIRTGPYLVSAEFPKLWLESLSFEQYVEMGDTLVAGAPSYYSDHTDATIYLLPAADAVTESPFHYPVIVPYWKRLDVLTDDADTNWFTVDAEDYLVWRAGSLAFEFNRDFEPAAHYQQKSLGEYKRLRTNEIRQRYARGPLLKPALGSRIGSKY